MYPYFFLIGVHVITAPLYNFILSAVFILVPVSVVERDRQSVQCVRRCCRARLQDHGRLHGHPCRYVHAHVHAHLRVCALSEEWWDKIQPACNPCEIPSFDLTCPLLSPPPAFPQHSSFSLTRSWMALNCQVCTLQIALEVVMALRQILLI